MKIKRNDTVVVVSGDDARPDTPHKVIQILKGGDKLVVEGVNRVLKHVKRGHPRSPQGGRLNLEMPIDCSNVMYYCGTCSKGTRLGYRFLDDGTKERFCKSCGESAGVIGPAKKQHAK